MFLDTKKIIQNKKSVDLVISINIDKYTTTKNAMQKLIEIAINNGANPNIKKQIFDDNGEIKIAKIYTFL